MTQTIPLPIPSIVINMPPEASVSGWEALFSVFTGMFAPLIAIVIAYVAVQQWRLARNRFKLDLFEKRYAVYEALRQLQSGVTSSAKPSRDDLQQFLVSIGESKWLFGDEIEQYLFDEYYVKANSLMLSRDTIQMFQDDANDASNRLESAANAAEKKIADDDMAQASEQLKQAVAEKNEDLRWLLSQQQVIDEKFSPYLKLNDGSS